MFEREGGGPEESLCREGPRRGGSFLQARTENYRAGKPFPPDRFDF